MKQPAAEKSVPSRPWLRLQDQRSLLLLVSGGLLMTVGSWWYYGGHQGGLIEIERASPLEATYKVDINRADWPEIIQLPNLGETLAQRVLLERQTNGPFRNVDDLLRVNGIGVKTLEKIRPYLLPIPNVTGQAASQPRHSRPVQSRDPPQ